MMEAYKIMERVREEKPLVHHMTNWVTIYDCANVTRTCGALPVMAHAPEEVAQMAGIASSLVLNIGTLTKEFIDSMVTAAKAANRKGIPVVLDAVGAGATDMRTDASKRLLKEVKIDIIKGNAGEIGVLAGAEAEVKGVESISLDGDPLEIAEGLARSAGATVVITGKQDIITDGKTTYKINNGHELMGAVVGTGCMSSSVIGSFAAVESDYAKAAASALACFGIAGELAADKAEGTGTFKEAFFDALYNLNQEQVESKIKIE
jgi:hydroxyethylthiazole kinase